MHEQTTLPSGLRVISETIDSVRSVAVGVFVGVGARDERRPEAGVTHLIEHLLFKGSERFDQVEIARVSDRLGSELNAFTTRESTVLHVRVLDEHLPLALDVMCDMAARPRFEAEALESEREVVLEEIAMIEDDPSDLVHDLAARCVFGDHELGRPVIGTAETVRGLTIGDIAGYHSKRYGAGNVVVAAAGNIEHDAFRGLVSDRPQLGAAERAERSTPVVVGGRQLFLARDTEQYHVCLSAPGLPRDDDRRFALALLDHVLGAAASSRLVQEIREERGMAYSVYSYTASYDDAGQVGIYVGTRAEHVGECVEIARAQMADFASGGLTADELGRAKESVKGRMLLALESTSSRMSRLGRAVLSGSEILSLDEVAARVDAVTHDDITAMAAELFAPGCFSIAGIGPDHDRFTAAVGGEVALLEAVA
ncbi:MAG TPA: pitrilysin family protein [Gaiellales bacterium]|nr:pitrilysin family protein [Gaiellales bacterium]